jgi:hypothetical protein
MLTREAKFDSPVRLVWIILTSLGRCWPKGHSWPFPAAGGIRPDVYVGWERSAPSSIVVFCAGGPFMGLLAVAGFSRGVTCDRSIVRNPVNGVDRCHGGGRAVFDRAAKPAVNVGLNTAYGGKGRERP